MAELWQIAALLRPFWRRLLLALLLSVLTIGSGIGLMMVSAWLISTAALQLGIVSLGVAPTAVRLFGLARALFRYLERLVSHDLTFRLLARLRVWFYERLEPLSLPQLQAYRRGDLIARVVADIEELQNFYLRVASPPLTAVLVTALTGLLFSRIDGRTALLLVALMLGSGTLLPLLAWLLGRRFGPRLVALRRDLHGLLLDAVQGLPDGLALGHAPRLQAAIAAHTARLAALELRHGRRHGLQLAATLLLTHLAATAVLWSAAGRVDGLLLATLALGTVAAFEAIAPLAEAGHSLGREQAAAARVLQLIAETPAIPSPPGERAPSPRPDLALHQVTFRYAAGETAVLSNFSLALPYGQHLLLSGESGAGKSSLVHLLLRFADYEQGAIRLGGHDLRAIPHETLRRTFAVMSQNTYLFNTTIGENIRIGRKTAADADVVAAARQAQVHDFIAGLPRQYDTYVGEGGVRLSGGERQRIALARMLLRQAPIWILDEPTANLDPATAAAVLDTLFTTGAPKTILLLSHRPELAGRFAFDQILTIRDGQAVAAFPSP